MQATPAVSGFTWAVVSALCLGIGTFLYKTSGKHLSPSNVTFFYYLFSLLLAFVVWIFTPERGHVERAALVWPALMALFLSASVWAFSSATRTIDMSAASTIRGLSFIPTVLLSIAVYHERPSIKVMIAMGLVVAAVFLLGWDTAEKQQHDKQQHLTEQ
jgi:drug/metabolite transporter (DMT)-like permease